MASAELAGKWCLVTGASRGIGQSIAAALAALRANLLLTARTADKLQETAEICQKQGAWQVELLPADLSQPADVARVAEHALQMSGGHVHMLVNNAGTGLMGGPYEGDFERWQAGVQLNLLAPMHLTRLLVPSMMQRQDGIIINICSVAGLEGMARAAAYAATKFGLRGWSLSCYQALRPHNIKVVCINPGFVETDMTAGFEGADHSKMMRPSDVADAALLAVRTSGTCCPQEITLRPVRPVM